MVQATSIADGPEPVGSQATSLFLPSLALDALGDRWSILIVHHAISADSRKLSDFTQSLAIEDAALVLRLTALVDSGLMEMISVDEYRLTPHGRSLEPVVAALAKWSESWPEPNRMAATTSGSDRSAPLRIEFSLLGSFSVRVGGRTIDGLSVGSQRLLVFLALHDRAVTRSAMAGTMWPDASDERAGISLRTALSRLDPATHEAVQSASTGLSLAAEVAIDFRDAQALARRLTGFYETPTEDDLGPLAVAALSMELLPDWFDDWVVSEAEDWRQLRMNALEAQADMLTIRGRLAEAAVVARAAMKVEPLRESSHACLIRVHLASGNQSEALRVYDRYTDLLRNVLDLEPTSILTDLVADIQKAQLNPAPPITRKP
jgi:DNA-binding SARP family transcriptional activator/DNA-binding HxlR family transcriptional regulator